jgi:hypothetical protein
LSEVGLEFTTISLLFLPHELERALDGLIPPGAEDDPGWDDDPQIPGPGPQPNPGDLPPEDPGGTTFEAGGSDPS